MDRKKDLAKDSNAYYELLRSNDLELGTESDLFCEVPCIRGEKPVRSRFQGGDEYGDISLVMDQMAMAVDFLLVFSPGVTIPPNVLARADKVIK